MITFVAKLEQDQGSRIRKKIQINLNQFYHYVVQVLMPSECIHCTDYGQCDSGHSFMSI